MFLIVKHWRPGHQFSRNVLREVMMNIKLPPYAGLRQAEARVDKITTDASGQASGTEPLDVQ